MKVSPAARKRAGELGIDLATLKATSPSGWIISKDVERAVAAVPAAPRNEVVKLADATKTAATMAGPAEAAETNIFLHGLGESQSTWTSVLGHFAEF